MDEEEDVKYEKLEQVKAWFEKHGDEYLEFERIPPEHRRHKRPDLCAFLYLSELEDDDGDIIIGAAHDEYWIGFKSELLTEDDVIYLTRCGISYEYGSLCSFA